MRTMSRGPRVLSVAAVAAVIACLWSSAGIQAAAVADYEVKAAFLYNFARFVEWPAGAFASPTDDLRVQVVGHDPFNGALDRLLKGKDVRGHRIAVEYSRDIASAKGAQVVFVSASEQGRVAQVLDDLRNRPTLTVSDIDGFTTRGGMIGLVTRDGTIRFDINRTAATRERLNVSSRLLSLAGSVRQ